MDLVVYKVGQFQDVHDAHGDPLVVGPAVTTVVEHCLAVAAN